MLNFDTISLPNPKPMKKPIVFILLIIAFSTVPYKAPARSIQNGALENLLVYYLQIKNGLVKSQNIQSIAADFLQSASAINQQNLSEEERKSWAAYSVNIIKDLEGLAASSDIEKQRKYFAALSVHFYPLVKTMTIENALYYQYCPMYNNGKGAYWISELSNIQNPYYGNKMLTCGSTKEAIH